VATPVAPFVGRGFEGGCIAVGEFVVNDQMGLLAEVVPLVATTFQ